ncbi:DMT family transporter [Oceanihabitans sediminis]|uniref:DMT family transporter n=1 Tax=Oceanihabitans sediminis TaxID=1812012 RepID=A0A368P6Y9_9FLAO|nr:DMT family transporter [Oceanihabitans sediminis]MDX1277496.1 DMT family transporter [Oceanihabitans sediminis]MDX1772837.1 DMT family transporter [Oceanihabitans sediminis]RBP34515.1 drug/metabolite transporter (DMT)-like permease [Oceanihabitans sediminis]RCU58183.1 DMT family transporter [Oceanihabitans sediminis]
MKKARIALVIGIFCISIFPILVKLNLTPGVISAFYRMLFSLLLLLPYVLISKQFKLPSLKAGLLAVLCGVVFGSDVAVWNIAIQESTATQASLLTNLSPVWVGVLALFFLKDKPKINFWIGTMIAIVGMILLVGFTVFKNLDFDLGFSFGILSGVLYSFYMLISKEVLKTMNVISFMTITLFSSSIYLGGVSYALNEPFSGFSNTAWFVLFIQAAVCQLAAWLLISFATQHMRATRVSVSLLGQGILASVLAWLFIDEAISLQMVFGGFVLLFGIRITFYEKPIFSAFRNRKSSLKKPTLKGA